MATFEDFKQGLIEIDDYLGSKRAGYKVTVCADVAHVCKSVDRTTKPVKKREGESGRKA